MAGKPLNLVKIDRKRTRFSGFPQGQNYSRKFARKEYFRLCGLAVDSTNITDSISLLTKEGICMHCEYFTHPEPEPEPNEE